MQLVLTTHYTISPNNSIQSIPTTHYIIWTSLLYSAKHCKGTGSEIRKLRAFKYGDWVWCQSQKEKRKKKEKEKVFLKAGARSCSIPELLTLKGLNFTFFHLGTATTSCRRSVVEVSPSWTPRTCPVSTTAATTLSVTSPRPMRLSLRRPCSMPKWGVSTLHSPP